MGRNLTACLGLVVTLLTSSSGLATEETKPPASGLAAAQAEFEQLKSDEKLKSNRAKLDLPQLGGLSAGHDDLTYVAPSLREQSLKDKKGTVRDPNWLVNAVMKDRRDDDRTTDEKDAEEAEADKDLDPMEKLIAEHLRGPSEPEVSAAQKSEADAKLSASVVNPLNAYMDGWVSARDRDLLLGDTKSSSDGMEHTSFTRPDSLANDTLRRDLPANVFVGPASAPGELFRVEQNPYLIVSPPGGRSIVEPIGDHSGCADEV
jgi:hypothetical protein|uniref:hypothetical protein n=1 Tax=Cephaloticoccus sp. TaxID=1985742 RepID=UPI00404B7065